MVLLQLDKFSNADGLIDEIKINDVKYYLTRFMHMKKRGWFNEG